MLFSDGVSCAAYRRAVTRRTGRPGTCGISSQPITQTQVVGLSCGRKDGKFQTGELMGFEVHVKDTKRFQGGWAFFRFRSTEPAQMIPMTEDCYPCHRDHAAVDTTKQHGRCDPPASCAAKQSASA